MTSENIETVAERQPVRIPVYALRGAISCVDDSKDAQPAMGGVFVHCVENAIRVASTDGHRLFVASLEQGEGVELPDWMKEGVLIPAADLKLRLSLLEKLENSTAIVSYGHGAPNVLVSDPAETCVFKMQRIEVEFPDYQEAVIEKATGGFSREVATDFQPVGYTASYLKEVGGLAKVLDSDYVRVFSSSEVEPSVIVFDSAPGVVLYLMPSKVSSPLAPQTARLLQGPIKGTIAALSAHKTRWTDKMEKLRSDASEEERTLIQERIDHFTQRIASVIANASPPALPAPDSAGEAEVKQPEEMTDQQLLEELGVGTAAGDEPPIEQTVEDNERSAEQAGAAAETIEESRIEVAMTAEADPIQPNPSSAAERAALSGKQAKRAVNSFVREVDVVLAQNGLGGLADRDRIAGWFHEGHSLENVLALMKREHGGEEEAETEKGPVEPDQPTEAEQSTEAAGEPAETTETEQGPAEPDQPDAETVRTRRGRARRILAEAAE